MPIYSYSCDCGRSLSQQRTIDDRERPAVCDVCGKEARFFPFGKAPATHMDVNYHKAGSSDGVVWDHLLGASATAGNIKMANEFQKKNKIIREGGAAVFRQDKGTYRPALGLDVPQIVLNRVAAKDPKIRHEIQSGKVANDLTDRVAAK